MTDPLPLWVWADNRLTSEQMERLREAKAEAGITELIQAPARAIPGCGRVLSFNGRPPFFCDWAETSWDDPQLPAKLKWAVTGVDGNPHSGLEWMQTILGSGVTQQPDEPYVERVGFK